MHSTVPLNRRILVAFLIGDTHTLERALTGGGPPPPPPILYKVHCRPPPPPRPFLSWCRCRGMFLRNYPRKESHRPFQILIHQERAFDHQMVDLDA